MDIFYNLEFHSYWHCGSGLSAGADLDSLTIKDKNGLPFVPGRTIKGLVRDALYEIGAEEDVINELLGPIPTSEEGRFNEDPQKKGILFFSNAELSRQEASVILKENLLPYTKTSISSTAIGDDGIAKEHSLRKTEVSLPCVLEGKIMDIPSEEAFLVFKDALQYIKRLGKGRNRGLGRCTFTIK